MITKIFGIGAFPDNKIYVKNGKEQFVGSSVVIHNCTLEIEIFDIVTNSVL